MRINSTSKSIEGVFLILIFMISVMTPLKAVSGIVMSMGLLMLLCFCGKRALDVKTITAVTIALITFLLYFLFTNSITEDRGMMNTSVVMFFTALTCGICMLDKSENKAETWFQSWFLDLLCEVLWIAVIVELSCYAIQYTSDWGGRLSSSADFFGIYHHVDFSVVVYLVSAIMFKRGKIIQSIILAVCGCLILPARTLKLLLMLFVLFYILKRVIIKIVKRLKISSFFIMMVAVIASISLSYIWVYVLQQRLEVVNGHEGLFDTSNMERFETILYAGAAIIREKLLFVGVDRGADYSLLLDGLPFVVKSGPHNSYIQLFLYYSVLFGGTFLFIISKVIDHNNSEKTLNIAIPYIMAACILHGMFDGPRGILFLAAIIIPAKAPCYSFRVFDHVKTVQTDGSGIKKQI